MTTPDAALLPCPFCGYDAHHYHRLSRRQQRHAGYGRFQYFVSCKADLECEAVLGGFPDLAGAIDMEPPRWPIPRCAAGCVGGAAQPH